MESRKHELEKKMMKLEIIVIKIYLLPKFLTLKIKKIFETMRKFKEKCELK